MDYSQLSAEDKTRLSNPDLLPALFLFDQWVFNDDRKPQHIMVGEFEGGKFDSSWVCNPILNGIVILSKFSS